MKKFNYLPMMIILLGSSALTLVSCDKDDDKPDALQAVVDVYVQDLITESGVKYGISVQATANNEIKSAKVTAPGSGGKVYQLTAGQKKGQFIYVPKADEYAKEFPTKGDYQFEIISTTNETITGKDIVGDEKLDPIVIKSATLTNNLLKTTWDKLQNCDAFAVRLYSANKSELLFAGKYLAADKLEYEFGATTSGWATGKSPVAKTEYVLELLGIRYETGVTTNKENNIQFVTLDSKTIKWE